MVQVITFMLCVHNLNKKKSIPKKNKQTKPPMADYIGISQYEYIFLVPVIKLTVLKSNSFGWMDIGEKRFFQ